MKTSNQLSRLIHSIYKASYNPEHWHYVLSETAEFVGANSMSMLYRDSAHGQTAAVHTYNVSREALEDYLGYYCRVDPTFKLAASIVGTGTGIADHQMIPNRKDLKHRHKEFYDYMVRHNHFYLCGAILIEDGQTTAAISGQRGRAEGPWPQASIDKFTDLAPHFQQALHIYQEFTHRNLRESVITTALNSVALGVLLLDRDLRVVYTNDAATTILDNNSTLSIINHWIVTTNSRDTQQIQNGLKAALDNANTGPANAINVLGITSNPTGPGPYRC